MTSILPIKKTPSPHGGEYAIGFTITDHVAE